MRTGKGGRTWAGGAQGGGRNTPSRAGLVTKAEERSEFCRRMGWRIERITKQQLQVIGVDGVVLFERGESYVNGYTLTGSCTAWRARYGSGRSASGQIADPVRYTKRRGINGQQPPLERNEAAGPACWGREAERR